MFVDLRQAGDDLELESDVCIVGGGPVGITLARELGARGHDVCLLESGGFELDARVQDLYRGEDVGQPNFALDTSRLRFWGGTSNHWRGWCSTLKAIDLRRRDWFPFSGWPVDRHELEPYYVRARSLLGLDPGSDYDVWQSLGVEPVAFDPERVRAHFWQYNRPPLRFGTAFRADLEAARNVRVVLYASATKLAAHPDAARLVGVEFRSLEGDRGRARARLYVLACGGIENPRLLLASNDVEPAGLGNRHDRVGRFFMDHFRTAFADVVSPDPHRLMDRHDVLSSGDRRFRCALRLADGVQAREGIGNTGAYLRAIPERDSGIEALDGILADWGEGESVDDLGGKLRRILADLDGTAREAWRRYAGEHPYSLPIESIRVVCFGDQAPNPDSRVRLADERDALGMRRVRLDWRLSEVDRRGLRVLGETLGAELGRLGLGRLRLRDWLADAEGGWGPNLVGGYHHMGTTRMTASPRDGVVDADCRVHGKANLYVGGSSVFATAGYANPTLTILALTYRLADHLSGRLARSDLPVGP